MVIESSATAHGKLVGPVRPQHAVQCLKADGLHAVWLIHPPGQSLRTLKTWPVELMMLLKLVVGIAQPQRQIRGAKRLERAGIPTPRCFGSWRMVKRGGHRLVELEINYAQGKSALDLLIASAEGAPVSREMLVRAARKLGRMVVQFADAGLFHRDLKPSNVVIDDRVPADPAIWIIDPVGVRPMRRRLAEIERMLERLALKTGRLDPTFASALRMAGLRAATRSLSRVDRREVFRLLRVRIGRAS